MLAPVLSSLKDWKDGTGELTFGTAEVDVDGCHDGCVRGSCVSSCTMHVFFSTSTSVWNKDWVCHLLKTMYQIHDFAPEFWSAIPPAKTVTKVMLHSPVALKDPPKCLYRNGAI